MTAPRFTVRQRHLLVGVTGRHLGPGALVCGAHDLRRPLPDGPQFTFTYEEAAAALDEARTQLPGLLRYAQLHAPVLRAAPVPPRPDDQATFRFLRRAFARHGLTLPLRGQLRLHAGPHALTGADVNGETINAALLADLSACPDLLRHAPRRWAAQPTPGGCTYAARWTPEGYPVNPDVLT